MRLNVKEHDAEGQVGFLGILQKVTGQCTVVKHLVRPQGPQGMKRSLGDSGPGIRETSLI